MGESPEAKRERAFLVGRLNAVCYGNVLSGAPPRGGAEALAWGTVQVIAAQCRDYLDPGWEEVESRAPGRPGVRDSSWVAQRMRP